MKLSVNKKSPRLSMSSKKALKQKKDSDVGGVKKSQIRLPLWNEKTYRFYDHPFARSCFVVSDTIFHSKITKFLNLEELFVRFREVNAARTGSQVSPHYMQTLEEMFKKVDPDLICWHL